MTSTAGVNARAEQVAALARRVSTLIGTARNADGSIEVIVDSTGAIMGLDLKDEVQRLSGKDLSRQIMGVMRAAQAEISTGVADAVRQNVGADTETGRAIIDSFARRFPEPVDESRSEHAVRPGGSRGDREL